MTAFIRRVRILLASQRTRAQQWRESGQKGMSLFRSRLIDLIPSFLRECRNSRPGKFCIKAIPVQTSLSAGCEVRSDTDQELQGNFLMKACSDSGGGVSQLKGGCILSESVPISDSSSHAGSVWPKSMRRQASCAQGNAHESHLLGGILREDSIPQVTSKSTFRGSEIDAANKLRNQDSVGMLISGEFHEISSGVADTRSTRKQVPHRS